MYICIIESLCYAPEALSINCTSIEYIYIYIKKKQTRGCQELRWEGWKGGTQEVREAAVSSVTPSRWTRDTVYPQMHRTRTWNRVNIMLTVDFSWVQCVHADSLVYQMQHAEKGTQVSIGGGSCMEGSCWGSPPLSAPCTLNLKLFWETKSVVLFCFNYGTIGIVWAHLNKKNCMCVCVCVCVYLRDWKQHKV